MRWVLGDVTLREVYGCNVLLWNLKSCSKTGGGGRGGVGRGAFT